MDMRNFPIGRVIFVGFEIFALVMLNLVGYYLFNNIPRTKSSDPYCIESNYEKYPVFSGTVTEISALDYSEWIEAAALEENTAYEPQYKQVDSVKVGWESLNTARIKVSNLGNSRWFYINHETYIYDEVADNNFNITIKKGQHVNFAYGQKYGVDGTDFVYAVKGKEASFFTSPFFLAVLIPNIIIISVSIVLIVITASGSEETSKRAFKGLVAFSVISLLVVGFLIGGVYSYLKKALSATARVRAHAPVIYLYSEDSENINVVLDIKGDLTMTYPKYNASEGWNVTAKPDGMLTDISGDSYRFLYWEADLDMDYDLSKGFCVKGSDTKTFLEKALKELGMNDVEASDFMAYWLPVMTQNEYNVITFQTTAYTDAAKLNVSPAPDVVVRINMLWYSSDEFVNIAPQDLTGINPAVADRHGLVLVEWGGEAI